MCSQNEGGQVKLNHDAIEAAISVPLQQDMCVCGHARAFHAKCCGCVTFIKKEKSDG